MTRDSYTIRTMTRQELDLAIEWAAAEGWNPGLHDADCFYAADPNGFLIGVLTGEPIACISVVKYGEAFGFLGFYIVKPEFRERGYGWRLWQAGLDYLQGRNIGLDGVVAQQENYVKSGFELAHQNIRYEGLGGRIAAETTSQKQNADEDVRLLPLAALSLSAVLEYDNILFLENRSAFLNCWLGCPHHVVVGLMHNQAIAGYGVLRPCRSGYKIGPLFADTPAFAEEIFLALSVQVEPDAPLYLDVPAVNSAAIALAEKHLMTPVFETARMYTQAPPALPLSRIFGITSFELG
ncbi:MAG: GNAT family N-acetyltransferase [Phormidesmis sp.]